MHPLIYHAVSTLRESCMNKRMQAYYSAYLHRHFFEEFFISGNSEWDKELQMNQRVQNPVRSKIATVLLW